MHSLSTAKVRNAYKTAVVQFVRREHKDGSSKELSRGDVVCLYVTHGRDERQAFLIEVTNVRVPEQVGGIYRPGD